MLIKRRDWVSRRQDQCLGVPKLLKEIVHRLALRVDDLQMTKCLRMAEEETADEREGGTGLQMGTKQVSASASNGETKSNIDFVWRRRALLLGFLLTWNCG
jgi:hypothetical protein